MERIGIEKCRVCGSHDLERLFSLGNLSISTFVDQPGQDIGRAPLNMVWCNNCTLVQLEHTAPQELMYSGHYWYRSGLNNVIINDLKEITEIGAKMVDLKSGDMVRFAVKGTTNSGSFTAARFIINTQTASATKRGAADEFYYDYTIPEGETSFTVKAQIQHSTGVWSN